MPVVEDKEQQLIERRFKSLPEFEDKPELLDLAMATFRLENSVGSTISRAHIDNLPDGTIEDSNYNPWNELNESEKLDEQFFENAMMAESSEELNAVRKMSTKERRDRDTLSKGGALSFALSFGIGGIADPINLIPVGGTTYKSYKTGDSILKAALATGSVATVSTGIQESILHFNQLERTYGESATNMSAAFLLGGALGAGAQKLAQWGADTKTMKEIEDSMNVEPKIREGLDSVGAARADADVEVKGSKLLKKFIKGVGFDALTRTLLSQSPVTRKIANTLAENPIEMDKGGVTAVESLAKIHDGKYVAALEEHLNQYRSLQAELGGKTGVMRLINKKGMSKVEFNELVGKEMRNPSPEAPAQVKAAAASWRSKLYDPMKELMLKGELIKEEDLDLTTAVSYLNRVWSKHKIATQLPRFINKVAGWLEAEDAKLFDLANLQKQELKKIETSQANLKNLNNKKLILENQIERAKQAKKKNPDKVNELNKKLDDVNIIRPPR